MRHVYQDQTIGGADILNSLADVNIGNPEDGQMLVYDASTQRWRNVTQKSLNDLAEVTDLTNVIATGSTNATGATIPKGLYFYLNDELCQAKADIANGATFTLNTNYEVVTAGGLNSLNSALTPVPFTLNGASGVTIDSNQTKCYKIGHIVVITALFTLTSATTAKTYTFASVPNEYKPRNVYACFAADNTNDIPVSGMISDNGDVKMYRNGTQSATSFRLSATYVIN